MQPKRPLKPLCAQPAPPRSAGMLGQSRCGAQLLLEGLQTGFRSNTKLCNLPRCKLHKCRPGSLPFKLPSPHRVALGSDSTFDFQVANLYQMVDSAAL